MQALQAPITDFQWRPLIGVAGTATSQATGEFGRYSMNLPQPMAGRLELHWTSDMASSTSTSGHRFVQFQLLHPHIQLSSAVTYGDMFTTSMITPYDQHFMWSISATNIIVVAVYEWTDTGATNYYNNLWTANNYVQLTFYPN